MKRETLKHFKTWKLAELLKVSRPTALGYLQLLWDLCGDITPRGDIGRCPDAQIANYCDWEGKASDFIGALVEAGWLEIDQNHRLVVHDWRDHCESWVRKKLERNGLQFVETTGGQCPDNVRTSSSISHPIPSNPNPSKSSSSKASSEPADFVFPTVGKGDKEWRPTLEDVEQWREAFPALDVEQELRKAVDWCRRNKKNRKTPGGMPRFLHRWLSSNQDRAPPRNGKPRGQATFLRLEGD